MIKTFEDLEAVRLSWERWQDHPNNDFAQFKMVCQLRPEVEHPCVTVIEHESQPNALLAGRLEHTQFAPSIGYLKPVKIPAKLMIILHRGSLGQMDQETATKTVEYLWSLLGSGIADAIEFHYLSEKSPILLALRNYMSRWLCEKRQSWNIHWAMDVPAKGPFIEHKVRSKHRSWIRKKERELESAFPGKVSWRWMSKFDDVNSLISQLEIVAARAYQRGLGTGFMDNEEFRRRFALFGEREQLRVQLLEIDGLVKAFWFGYLYQGVFHLSETGYDPELQKYEVGTMLFIRLNDELIREGVRKLDFGIGDSSYKRRFGDQSWREATVWLFAPTAKGLFLRTVLAIIASIDRFGRGITQKLGILNRLKVIWRRRLAAKSSEESLK